MNNIIWADYLIYQVRKDSLGNVIKVNIGKDNINGSITFKEETKEYVINILKNNETVITVTSNNGHLVKGAKVIFYIDRNNNEQIKTISNKDDKDNLDNLPLF